MVVPPTCTDFETTSTTFFITPHQRNPTSISDRKGHAFNAFQSEYQGNAKSEKFRLFTYPLSYNDVLLIAISNVGARKAEHGKKEQAFEAVQDKAMVAIPETPFETYERPRLKSLGDRKMRLEYKRREIVCFNEVKSGNVGTVTDLDIHLDDLVGEKDEWKRQQQKNMGKS